MPSHAILHSGYAAILPDLQLRGSAGFSPASHSPAFRRPTIMREPKIEKEQKQQSRKFTRGNNTTSNTRLFFNKDRELLRSNFSNVCLRECSNPFQRRLQLPLKFLPQPAVVVARNAHLRAETHQRL